MFFTKNSIPLLIKMTMQMEKLFERQVIGTLRECFFCNQLISAGHKVEYGGIKTGDFRIDDSRVIEIGGADKDFSQVSDEPDAYVAADDIDSAIGKKIPLWAFGMLY